MVGLVLVCCVVGQGCHALYPFDIPDAPDQRVAPDAAPDAAGDGPSLQDAARKETLPPLDNGAPTDAPPPDALPPDALPPDAGKPKGAPCVSPGECALGLHCIDGYCCGSICSAKCVACDVSGSEGDCVPIPASPPTLCYKACSGTSLALGYCDGAGSCGVGTSKSCPNFLVCDPAQNDCPAGCTTHADCIKMDMTSGAALSSGVCDRTKAHQTGLGVCVDPAKVAEAGTPNFLTVDSALNKANEVTSTITHVLLRANTTYTTFQVKVVSGQQVTIVGVGRPILQSMTTSDADGALLVKGGTLLVQDVTITHMNTFKGHGARCLSGKLSIFESTIRDNSGRGVEIAKPCDFTLRRSLVRDNDGGGLSLQGGGGYNSTLVNNVIVKNGSTTSMSAAATAGLQLLWDGAPLPVIYNNVIADNLTGGSTQAGIDCNVSKLVSGAQYDLHNTIVWGNNPSGLSGGCKFLTSDVQTLSSLTSGNINSNPQFATALYDLKSGSPAVDTGGAVPTSVTVIDYNGGTRLQGVKTDMGAHER